MDHSRFQIQEKGAGYEALVIRLVEEHILREKGREGPEGL
jgi:hypothetical protein